MPTVVLDVFDQDVFGMMSLDSSLLSPLGHVIIRPVAAHASPPCWVLLSFLTCLTPCLCRSLKRAAPVTLFCVQ